MTAKRNVQQDRKLKCPKCRSTKVLVYDSSHLPIRYHKCTKCGLSFKSVEKS